MNPKVSFLVVVLTGSMFLVQATDPAKEFSLSENSAFHTAQSEFLRGQMSPCATQPYKEVKVYPRLKSAKPLYGQVIFAGDYTDRTKGLIYYYTLDESKGTGAGYDRLYFDANRDLDLSNDSPLQAQRTPPPGALIPNASYLKQQVCFEFLKLAFDYGAEGQKPLDIMPRLLVYESDGQAMTFVCARVFQGPIQIGTRVYNVVLGQDYYIGGRYDHPATALHLSPVVGQGPTQSGFGMDRLHAMHQLAGTFYQINANPGGNKLTVRPYQGDLGIFEIGPGQRKLNKLEMSGILAGPDKFVSIGESLNGPQTITVRKCPLPVGDYLPSYLTVTFGRLQISLSDNYHSEGKPRDRGGRPRVYAMKIQKDKPFVLDFSNPPAVMFASPGKLERIKAGSKVEVKAVLIDPRLDIMIRGLNDLAKQVETETKGPRGEVMKYQRNRSLDPKVVITRANGEKVAEGVMPFG